MNTFVSSPNTSCCDRSQMKSMKSSVSSSTQVRKRTIRFEDNDENDTVNTPRPVKRARIADPSNVSATSQITEQERSACWMQKADSRATAQDVQQVIKTCQASADTDESTTTNPLRSRSHDAYVNFAEAIATTYNLCNQDEEALGEMCSSSGSSTARKEDETLPLDRMIVFGLPHGDSRGLESKIIPGLGIHRFKKRREVIQGVLAVQRELKTLKIVTDDDKSEGLGAVSEYLSQSARRFARALGAVDGTMALLEYASTANSQSTMMEATQASSIGAFLSMQASDSIVS